MSVKQIITRTLLSPVAWRKHVFMFATALLLTSIIAIGLTRFGRRAVQPNLDATALPQPTLSRLVQGQRLVYELEYSGKAVADFSILSSQGTSEPRQTPVGSQQTFHTTLTGQFVATVLQRDAEKTVVAYRVRDAAVRVSVNGQESWADAEAAEADLGREVYASLDEQGRVISLQFDSATGTLAQSVMRSLLAAVQFVAPAVETKDLRKWQAEEEDANGRYLAEYRLDERAIDAGDSVADVLSFEKTKLNYFQPLNKQNAGVLVIPTTITPEGHIVVRFDARAGHLLELSGVEKQTISASGQTLAVSETSMRCNRVASETLSAGELSRLRNENDARADTAITTTLYPSTSRIDDESSGYEHELGGSTLASLLDELAVVEASTDQDGKAQLFGKLRALVYLYPEACPAIADVLRKAEPRGLTMQLMLTALTAVGHPAAQLAITETIRARADDWSALAPLVYALGRVSEPSESSELLLRGLAFNSADSHVMGAAQLSLGMMAANLDSTDTGRSARIVDALIRRLDSGSSAQGKQQLLAALGNAATQEAVAAVARYLKSAEPALRVSAMSTLCRCDPEKAEDWLAYSLKIDSDESVRLQAALEFQGREMTATSFAVQKEAVSTDNSAEVRLTLLSNLWQAQNDFPEARQILKRAALNDNSKDVRQAAAKLLKHKS